MDHIDQAIAELERDYRYIDRGAIPPPMHPDPVADQLWAEEAAEVRAAARGELAPAPKRIRGRRGPLFTRSTPTSADRPNHESGAERHPEGSTTR